MVFLMSGDTRLYYEVSGQGPAIVFAHESAADVRQWREQVGALSGNYRCIVYNSRGYIPSDVPKDDAAYGYDAAWQDLAAVVEQVVGGPAHIVGLSMGAYAGLMLGLHRPDLVSSLFLAGCGTGSTRQPDTRMRDAMSALAELFMEKGSEAGAALIAGALNRTGFYRRNPERWQAWYDDLVTHSAEGMARTFRNYQGCRPSIYAFEERVRQLDKPTMLAVGDEDSGCIEVNLFLKQNLPDAGLWMVPHSGHAVNLEAPEAFNRVLDGFLATVVNGAKA